MSREEAQSDIQYPVQNEHLDLVSVVRCRDCRYWRKDSDYTCRYCGSATTWMPNSYCSYGERRTDE